jgi:chromosome segregation ATPase
MTNEQGLQGAINTRPCWFPNCPNLVPQNPNGRQKLTCDQVVDGLLHSRMNKSLVERGKRSVPARGSAQSAPAAMQAASPVEVERPVTAARDTMGQLMGEVSQAVTGLAPLVARMEAAARTVADQEQVTAEINATQRAARRQVDEAEASRDAALLRVRDIEAELGEALAAQQVAEEVADTALEGEEVAKEQRDQALSERDAARAAETGQRDRAEGAEAELVDLRAGLERANSRAEMLVDQVNAAREQAAAADRLAGELRGEVTMLSDRLAAMTQRAEELSHDLATAREHAAQQGAQLAAATEAIKTAREHGEQRLKDANELHGQATDALRDEIKELREQLRAERAELARALQIRSEGEPVDEHQAEPQREAPAQPTTRRVRRTGKQ